MNELWNDLTQVNPLIWIIMLSYLFFLVFAWCILAIGAKADEEMHKMMDEEIRRKK